MFWMLRAALVIGVIFYLSPVRRGGESLAVADGLLAWIGLGSAAGPASSAPEAVPRLESLWQALPDEAKRAVVEEVVAKAAPGLAPPEVPVDRHPAPKTPAAKTSVDTLHPGDRVPTWRGEPHKPHG